METRKVIQVGSSIGVTLPKAVLEAKNINLGDELVISTTDTGILIHPQTAPDRREKITKLALNFADRYREDLEALADK